MLPGWPINGRCIIQEGAGPDPRLIAHWSFLDITPNTVTWRGKSPPIRGAWALEQEMASVRRADC
jgi:hypothetical protein